MNQFALLPCCTFPTDIIKTFVAVDAIVAILTTVGLLKGSTNLLFTVESQRRKLYFGKSVVVGILTIGF
jgi:hypothetical protein